MSEPDAATLVRLTTKGYVIVKLIFENEMSPDEAKEALAVAESNLGVAWQLWCAPPDTALAQRVLEYIRERRTH